MTIVTASAKGERSDLDQTDDETGEGDTCLAPFLRLQTSEKLQQVNLPMQWQLFAKRWKQLFIEYTATVLLLCCCPDAVQVGIGHMRSHEQQQSQTLLEQLKKKRHTRKILFTKK